MRRTLKSALVGAVTVTIVGAIAPVTPASADFGDSLVGGCGFVTGQNATLTGGLNQGVIYDLSVSQHQVLSAPSDATVSCWIDVNGAEQAGTRITVTDVAGSGVEAGTQPITFAAAGADQVSECQQVTFADGSTWVAPDGNVGTDCRPLTHQTVETIVCPILVTFGQVIEGRLLGAISVNPDGDVYLAEPTGPGNIWVYDCAPYGNGTGTPLVTDPLAGLTFIKLLLPQTLP